MIPKTFTLTMITIFSLLLLTTVNSTPLPNRHQHRRQTKDALSGFANCGSENDLLTLSTLTYSPYPVESGKPLQMNVTGSLKADITGGSFVLTASVLGVSLYSATTDLCSSVVCPVKAGTELFTFNFTVPDNLPHIPEKDTSFYIDGDNDLLNTNGQGFPTGNFSFDSDDAEMSGGGGGYGHGDFNISGMVMGTGENNGPLFNHKALLNQLGGKGTGSNERPYDVPFQDWTTSAGLGHGNDIDWVDNTFATAAEGGIDDVEELHNAPGTGFGAGNQQQRVPSIPLSLNHLAGDDISFGIPRLPPPQGGSNDSVGVGTSGGNTGGGGRDKGASSSVGLLPRGQLTRSGQLAEPILSPGPQKFTTKTPLKVLYLPDSSWSSVSEETEPTTAEPKTQSSWFIGTNSAKPQEPTASSTTTGPVPNHPHLRKHKSGILRTPSTSTESSTEATRTRNHNHSHNASSPNKVLRRVASDLDGLKSSTMGGKFSVPTPPLSRPDSPDLETPCACGTHQGQPVCDVMVDLSLKEVLKCLFGDGGSAVVREAHKRRLTQELKFGSWECDASGQWKVRKITYKYSFKAMLVGQFSTPCYEEQEMINQTARSSTPSVPYGTLFCTVNRYCLKFAGPRKTHVRVFCRVDFVKTLLMSDAITTASVEGVTAYCRELVDELKSIGLSREQNDGASSTNSNQSDLVRNSRRPSGPRPFNGGSPGKQQQQQTYPTPPGGSPLPDQRQPGLHLDGNGDNLLRSIHSRTPSQLSDAADTHEFVDAISRASGIIAATQPAQGSEPPQQQPGGSRRVSSAGISNQAIVGPRPIPSRIDESPNTFAEIQNDANKKHPGELVAPRRSTRPGGSMGLSARLQPVIGTSVGEMVNEGGYVENENNNNRVGRTLEIEGAGVRRRGRSGRRAVVMNVLKEVEEVLDGDRDLPEHECILRGLERVDGGKRRNLSRSRSRKRVGYENRNDDDDDADDANRVMEVARVVNGPRPMVIPSRAPSSPRNGNGRGATRDRSPSRPPAQPTSGEKVEQPSRGQQQSDNPTQSRHRHRELPRKVGYKLRMPGHWVKIKKDDETFFADPCRTRWKQSLSQNVFGVTFSLLLHLLLIGLVIWSVPPAVILSWLTTGLQLCYKWVYLVVVTSVKAADWMLSTGTLFAKTWAAEKIGIDAGNGGAAQHGSISVTKRPAVKRELGSGGLNDDGFNAAGVDERVLSMFWKFLFE
ncbi:hypothetical protein HDU76_000619 [Blyttiomyces sp. JEL0837]|nr:hypothetical protein HDU76_000619 [Blyttiomyces sp. JEL0837]